MPRPSVVFAIFAACACLVAGQGGARAEQVVTLSNGEWLPYMSETAPHYGVISRIVSEAFALEGVTVKYVFRPWSRALAEAELGQVDGSVIWSEGAAAAGRKRVFIMSDTVFEGVSVLFHLKSQPFDWHDFDDLLRYSIGGTSGYAYQFESVPGMRIDRAVSDELSIRKLLAGRFQLFPSDLEGARLILRTRFTPEQAAQVTYHPRPYNVTRYRLIMGRKNPANAHYIALFNRGLRRLKESGRYAQYMDELRSGT
jgi:polar amino acid transport system substrate-binding protein